MGKRNDAEYNSLYSYLSWLSPFCRPSDSQFTFTISALTRAHTDSAESDSSLTACRLDWLLLDSSDPDGDRSAASSASNVPIRSVTRRWWPLVA